MLYSMLYSMLHSFSISAEMNKSSLLLLREKDIENQHLVDTCESLRKQNRLLTNIIEENTPLDTIGTHSNTLKRKSAAQETPRLE